MAPNLHEHLFDYQSPSDLKEWGLIDIREVEERARDTKFRIVSSEYFDRFKGDRSSNYKNLVCIEDYDFFQKLRISADLGETEGEESSRVEVHTCESITANGTWAASGDGSNLTLDTDVFIQGDGSLNFDGAASYTSILMTNSDMAKVDLSDYKTGGSVYVYIYIPSTTGLTSFKLRIGSDSSNYFERTVTVTNENLSFQGSAWNLLRFDFRNATETGTADMDNVDYVRLEIVGGGTAAATTDWRLDFIVARRGVSHEVWYYTKFGWQSSTGTYLENSTADTDKINCDTDEYELYIWKGKELLAEDLKFFDEADRYRARYEAAKQRYIEKYGTERLIVQHTYRRFSQDLVDDYWLN